jgi:hypothetical protein
MASNPQQGGTTGPAASGIPYYYPAGVQVTITETPNSGYSFSSWTGSGTGSSSGTSTSETITMNGNIIESANFVS